MDGRIVGDDGWGVNRHRRRADCVRRREGRRLNRFIRGPALRADERIDLTDSRQQPRMKTKQDAPISLAVVTGGHAYDVKGFHGLFRRFPEFDTYIQHMDDFCSSPEDVRDAYDVV